MWLLGLCGLTPIDALMTQAAGAIRFSPGARAYYDKLRARGAEYNSALRQLSNRLVGILHGCLKTGTVAELGCSPSAIRRNSLTGTGVYYLFDVHGRATNR
ncbi:hypothetical protein [Nonomuraea sp. LPB2021202275-12-8]|uniref:hypothetical protein n=1 Tax=Nonomuraea sp. LPB2021202275-12-8 TaxID=3120159 RepID=UPI003FA59197